MTKHKKSSKNVASINNAHSKKSGTAVETAEPGGPAPTPSQQGSGAAPGLKDRTHGPIGGNP